MKNKYYFRKQNEINKICHKLKSVNIKQNSYIKYLESIVSRLIPMEDIS